MLYSVYSDAFPSPPPSPKEVFAADCSSEYVPFLLPGMKVPCDQLGNAIRCDRETAGRILSLLSTLSVSPVQFNVSFEVLGM